MSLFADSLAAQIRAARAALRGNDNAHHPLRLAAERAADCLADLERAQRLLDSERSSAEAAERALDRAAQLFEVEQQQQRRADEAAAEAEADQKRADAIAGARAMLGAVPALDCEADPERDRLIKTIALAEEAIGEATALRSTAQPGEAIEATRKRWDDAHQIETAAIACRKAARKALAAVAVFPDLRSDFETREMIEAARYAALDLKAAIDAHRERAQRGRVGRKKGGAK